MTDKPLTRTQLNQILLSVATLADPKCKKPRPRLRQIQRMLEDRTIDKLLIAQACLEEVEREPGFEQRKHAWFSAKRRLAKLRKKREN
jgi:hypothetical protein